MRKRFLICDACTNPQVAVDRIALRTQHHGVVQADVCAAHVQQFMQVVQQLFPRDKANQVASPTPATVAPRTTIAQDLPVVFGTDAVGRRRRMLATWLQKAARDKPISLPVIRKHHPKITGGTLNWDMHVLSQLGYAREVTGRPHTYQALPKPLPSLLPRTLERLIYPKGGRRRPGYRETAKLLAVLQKEKTPAPVRSLLAATGLTSGAFHGHFDLLRKFGYATMTGDRSTARYSITPAGREVPLESLE